MQTNFVGPVQSQLQCGGVEAVRSMSKSGLALLATVVGTAPLRNQAFAQARDFVLTGKPEFLEQCTATDARPLPSPAYEYLVEAYGPMFNLIYVKSNSQGRTLVYFHLFNLFSWQIVLAEANGPANVEIALASNPLEPAQWDDKVADRAHLDFDWLDSPDDSERIEVTFGRMSAIMELYQELSRERLIRTIITETLGKYYIEGDLIEWNEKGRKAFAEISSRLAVALMQVPTEMKFTLTRSERPSDR